MVQEWGLKVKECRDKVQDSAKAIGKVQARKRKVCRNQLPALAKVVGRACRRLLLRDAAKVSDPVKVLGRDKE